MRNLEKKKEYNKKYYKQYYPNNKEKFCSKEITERKRNKRYALYSDDDSYKELLLSYAKRRSREKYSVLFN